MFISYFSFAQSSQKYFNSVYVNSAIYIMNDADAEFQMVEFKDYLTIGIFYKDHWMMGFSTEDSRTDFRVDGLEPIPDSLLISEMQFLTRYYSKYDYYLQIKLPFSSQITDVSILDQIRIGAGYQFKVYNDFFLDAYYDLYALTINREFRKGKLSLGISFKL